MDNESTAIRLADKLVSLTQAGKLKWMDAGKLGPWGSWPGQMFKAPVEGQTFAQIAEVPLPDSAIHSYYFGVAEANPVMLEGNIQNPSREILSVFAEGYPAAPNDENQRLFASLRSLYLAAHSSLSGTQKKVEEFEEALERLA